MSRFAAVALMAGVFVFANASAASAAVTSEGRSEDRFEHLSNDPSFVSSIASNCVGADAIESATYSVNGSNVPSLQGNVRGGSLVSIAFTLAEGCADTTVGLATYNTSSDQGDAVPFEQRKLVSYQSGVFTPAEPGRLTLVTQPCYFQIDFFTGDVKERLTAAENYSAPIDNLVASANGGNKLCDIAPVGNDVPLVSVGDDGGDSVSVVGPPPPPSDAVVTVPGPSAVVVGPAAVSTCPTNASVAVRNISYSINNVPGYSTLDNNAKPGDHIRVHFTVAEGCSDRQLSLASYRAADDWDEVAPLFGNSTGLFDAGDHTLDVTLPDCIFIAYFVDGPALEQLGPGSINTYADSRVHDHGVGGTACPEPAETAVVDSRVSVLESNDGAASVLEAAINKPVVSRVALARTGSDSRDMSILGVGLLLLGASFLALARLNRDRRPEVGEK